jgi:hypothetical protein
MRPATHSSGGRSEISLNLTAFEWPPSRSVEDLDECFRRNRELVRFGHCASPRLETAEDYAELVERDAFAGPDRGDAAEHPKKEE